MACSPPRQVRHLRLSIPHDPKGSPVPPTPTPPPQIPVSPAALSRLSRCVPAVHATPSLDGSVSSDQISSCSAPATPESHAVPDDRWDRILGGFPRNESARSDRGVVLPEGAMATLQHIPLDSPHPADASPGMRPRSGPPTSADGATPASDRSAYSFTSLSIPSPSDFFSSLAPRARRTWSLPCWNNPPSSATAERFYDLPWRKDGGGGGDVVVEQVVECPERESDDQPTAIRIPPEVQDQPENHESPVSPDVDAVQEIQRDVVFEYDENYEEELRQQAVANLDRTSVWLAAQTAYLAALRETNPGNEMADAECRSPGPAKKAVRFVDTATPPPTRASTDSIYWRGFQSVRRRSRHRDAFLHSNTRFDAVQSVRLGLPDRHLDGLAGKYEIVGHERPPYKGPFSQAPRNSSAADVLAEQAQWDRLAKEQLVLAQLRQSMWAMDALRYLNGGRLVASPASKRLSTAAPGRRRRVLDLGGHAAGEWAWHMAHDYRHVQIYTVVTRDRVVDNGIKGPANHRQVTVPHLWKLPFRDNRFDVISARSLPSLLRTERPIGQDVDEYDLCLQECYRCLKPGGYIEFFVLNAEIARAGPYATAASVEFAFNLKTRGYDPTPTKGFLARLRKARFTDIQRAWMYLPMGVEPVQAPPPRETPDPRVPSQVDGYEAVHGPVGSTADVASMTGLLGGWMWEQWLLKLQKEMGRERGRLLEGVGGVFDEGRKTGAGWTCLCGWAMKPVARKP